MSGPLQGIRVIDWTGFQMGPVTGMMLGDLGADVIKLEDRVSGDPIRGMMKVIGQSMGLSGGRNFYFDAMNRNKRGMTLDLKKPEGKDIIHRLVAKSDVVIQNWRLGVAEKLGMDFATLSKYNPKLVYGAATGLGQKGPMAEKPSFDTTGLGYSGFLDAISPPNAAPQYPNGALGDQLGGIMLTLAVLGGLMARERLGLGQQVYVSQLGSLMWLQGLTITNYLQTRREPPKWDRARAGNPLMNYYKCADGRWVYFGGTQSDRHWPAFCAALDMTKHQGDPRFCASEVREKNCAELVSLIDGIVARKPLAEWMEIFKRYPDFPLTPINKVTDLDTDPQVLANDYIVNFQHPSLGPTPMVGIPIELSQTPGAVERPAPEFGQHTEEVLIDICGYTWDEVAGFREREVI